MGQEQSETNKAIVREAFDTLFNKKDYAAADRFWAEEYIQHSAHIPPGKDGFFGFVKALPDEFAHELELIMAEGDVVLVRGRFSGHGLPAPWIVVDTVRMEDELLKEHWDVVENEVSRENSASGLPMFGDVFPEDRQFWQKIAAYLAPSRTVFQTRHRELPRAPIHPITNGGQRD
jgi:predicted SnoaL-like aldol condensation-catalyzing enzyme